LIHALPGVGATTVELDSAGTRLLTGAIGFAHVTPWRSLRSGRFHWSMKHGGETLAQGDATVGEGAYDMILLAKPSGISLGVYRARSGEPSESLLRVIHAAPELGAPMLQVDGEQIASSLPFARATPYRSVVPGGHSVSATRAGNPAPLVSAKDLRLAAGRSYSAILVGSRGRRLRIVTVTDRGAPLTRASTHGAHGHRTASGAPARTVVVHAGDSLWTIAHRHLGPAASDVAIYREVAKLWELNRQRIGTGDPNLIFPGQRLVFPD
jgi:hypothetical protein